MFAEVPNVPQSSMVQPWGLSQLHDVPGIHATELSRVLTVLLIDLPHNLQLL